MMMQSNKQGTEVVVQGDRDNETSKAALSHLLCPEVLPHDTSNWLPLQQILRIRVWSNNKADVIASLKELGDKLTSRKDRRAATHRLQFHRCQGYAILVGVMVRWYTSPHIQTLCCLSLHNASFHGEHLLQQGRDIGVMDTVLWAMETYTDMASLQCCACAIMARMVTSASNADSFVKGHGLGLLCRSLRKFPDNEGIRNWATHCLDELLKYGAFRQKVLAVWARCSEERTNRKRSHTGGDSTAETTKRRHKQQETV